MGIVAYLTQLLGTGFFHADPHPGNLIRTADGRLAILDFGLMLEIEERERYGIIECVAHLVHRDYERIGDDLVTLGFLPPGQDISAEYVCVRRNGGVPCAARAVRKVGSSPPPGVR